MTPRPQRTPRLRDRHGRGLRRPLAPPAVPLSRTRADGFDAMVLDAVEQVEQRWATPLTGVEFAVDDIPPADTSPEDYDGDVVTDRGVPLGRLFRNGVDGLEGPVIIVYRRPVEARTKQPAERAELVFGVVVELAAEYLGRDADEIDPPR